MQRLVEAFYPSTVRSCLLQAVAHRHGIPKYRIASNPEATEDLAKLRRRTLFMALSDGARLDILRHSNVGMLGNEQFVVATQVDADKWKDLLKNLRKEQGENAKFAIAYLIDDFMGTGTSFLRYDAATKVWKGKLLRFRESMLAATAEIGECPFEEQWELCVHHYIAGFEGAQSIRKREIEARTQLAHASWCRSLSFSFGTILPQDLPLTADPARQKAMIDLTKKYYDPILRTEHTDVGGVEHLGLGYGGCGLPLVLEHNTPNNSVALLWAETEGGSREGGITAPAMRPLFRRRQRHS